MERDAMVPAPVPSNDVDTVSLVEIPGSNVKVFLSILVANVHSGVDIRAQPSTLEPSDLVELRFLDAPNSAAP